MNHEPNQLIQKRVPVILRRIKCFLYCSWRYPAQQVDHRPGFVVCSRTPGATERLLAYHSTGWLIVYIEISGGVTQMLCGFGNSVPVLCDDGAGEGIDRCFVDDIQHLIKTFILVNINAQYRAE